MGDVVGGHAGVVGEQVPFDCGELLYFAVDLLGEGAFIELSPQIQFSLDLFVESLQPLQSLELVDHLN